MVNKTYHGDFIMYKNIESLSCRSETDILLHVNYDSVKKKKQKNKLQEDNDLHKGETGYSLMRKQPHAKNFLLLPKFTQIQVRAPQCISTKPYRTLTNTNRAPSYELWDTHIHLFCPQQPPWAGALLPPVFRGGNWSTER